MLAIRLTRTGKKNDPHYRIVVQEKRSKLNGKSVDTIGHYHPATIGKELVLDKEKAIKWMGLGAQPSDTVTNLLVKEGILSKDRTVHHFYTPKPKEEKSAKKEAAVAEKEAIEELVAEEIEEATPEVASEPETAPEEGTEAPAEEVAAEPAEEPTA